LQVLDSSFKNFKHLFAFAKKQGALMVLSWMFFASVGIIVSSYYKMTLGCEILDIPVWFLIHRPLMLAATFTTLASFFVVWSALKWGWVVSGTGDFSDAEFAHSIFGSLVIGFSIFQVFFLNSTELIHSASFIQ
jgi:hypothetical protein